MKMSALDGPYDTIYITIIIIIIIMSLPSYSLIIHSIFLWSSKTTVRDLVAVDAANRDGI
jgi:hypothetical protein